MRWCKHCIFRKCLRGGIIISLLVSQQGFLFYEALAAHFYASAGINLGGGTNSAASVGIRHVVSPVRLDNLNAVVGMSNSAFVNLHTGIGLPKNFHASVGSPLPASGVQLGNGQLIPRNLGVAPVLNGYGFGEALGSGGNISAAPSSRQDLGQRLVAPSFAGNMDQAEAGRDSPSWGGFRQRLANLLQKIRNAGAGLFDHNGTHAGAPLEAPAQAWNNLSVHTGPPGAPASGASALALPEPRNHVSGNGKGVAQPGWNPALYRELRHVLVHGRSPTSQVNHFEFYLWGGDRIVAWAPGLQGFSWTQRQIELRYGQESLRHHLEQGHYFDYIKALLGPVPWAAGLLEVFEALRREAMEWWDKNNRFNIMLAQSIAFLKREAEQANPAQWVRKAVVYDVLARAWPEDFFNALRANLARIREEIGANVLWLQDIFIIDDWGRIWPEGSPYAIQEYSVKPEYGGDAALDQFIEEARSQGVEVAVDIVPHSGSLNWARRNPQHSIHILPSRQPREDENIEAYKREILREAPRDPSGNSYFALMSTRNYPGQEGRNFWVLFHHPRFSEKPYSGDHEKWIDMVWRSPVKLEAWDELIDRVERLARRGVRLFRRDMAHHVAKEVWYGRVRGFLMEERDASSGWAREAMDRLIAQMDRDWENVKDLDFLARMSDRVQAAVPDDEYGRGPAFWDEGYGSEEHRDHLDELDRAGSDGVYLKSHFARERGQTGLYEALRTKHAPTIRAARRHVASRNRFVGAAGVTSISNLDEADPNRVFGPHALAAAALAHSKGANIIYNGWEAGVPAERFLSGDFAGSMDGNKFIPLDKFLQINFYKLKNLGGQERRLRILLQQAIRDNLGILADADDEVPDPVGNSGEAVDSPIVLVSSGREPAPGKARKWVIVAANFSDQEGTGKFPIGQRADPLTAAFRPEPGKTYRLRDRMAPLSPVPGQYAEYRYTGEQLLEGLYIRQAPGQVHFFEVEEVESR